MRAGVKVFDTLMYGNNFGKMIDVVNGEFKVHALHMSLESIEQFVINTTNKLVTFRPHHVMLFGPRVFTPYITIADLHGPMLASYPKQKEERVAERLAATTEIGATLLELENHPESTESEFRSRYRVLEQLVHTINPLKQCCAQPNSK